MVMTSWIHVIYVHSYMSLTPKPLCDFGDSLFLFQIDFYDLFVYLPTFSHNKIC